MRAGVAELEPVGAARPRRRPWVRRLFSLVGVVVISQVTVWLNRAVRFMNPALLPTPAGVLQGASEQIAEGILHLDILYSLYRVTVGFVLGTGIAVAVGCVAGSFPAMEEFLDPGLEVLRPIPPLAWLPLFIFWLGIGEPSKQIPKAPRASTYAVPALMAKARPDWVTVK